MYLAKNVICQNRKIIHYHDYVSLAKYSKVQEQKLFCDFTHILEMHPHAYLSNSGNCCFSQTKPEIGALVSDRESGEGVNIRQG